MTQTNMTSGGLAIGGTEDGRRKGNFVFARMLFYLYLGAYLLYPNDDEFRVMGIGQAGGRILLLDVFVFLASFAVLKALPGALARIVSKAGKVSVVLFLGLSFFSLARGIPEYGGFALGEGRWYLSAVLVCVGYALFNGVVAHRIKIIVLFVASIHALTIFFRYVQGEAWDISGDVIRFGTGRESLVIALASIYLLHDIFLVKGSHIALRWLQATLVFAFCLALIIGQTRTIFLILPLAFMVSYLFVSRISAGQLFRFGFRLGTVLLAAWLLIPLLVTGQIEESVENSFGVVAEVFSPATYGLLLDPSSITGATGEQFSSAGNTYFRLLAWIQVVNSLTMYPGGWLVGLPMGSGFEWYDAFGTLYVDLDPHNDYISILSKIGILGLAGYFLILWGYLKSTWSLRNKSDAGQLLMTPIPMLFATVVLLLMFVSLNAEVRSYGMHFWLWLFLGFGFRSVIDFENRMFRTFERGSLTG